MSAFLRSLGKCSLFRWAGLLVGLPAALFLLVALGLCLWGVVEDDAPADAAVVLGNAVEPDGTLSPRFRARLDRALELYRQGTVRLIIVSGAVGREGHDEAEVGTTYLAAQGVPAEALVADSTGRNTRATAEFTAAFAETHDLKWVIAVSQYFHLPRCRLAFAEAGLEDVGASYARYLEWRDIYSIAREVPAVAAYWLGVR